MLKWSEAAQSCPTLCDPMDCILPGSSIHGIFQAIVLEWIAISFSRGSSQPRDRTRVSRIVDRRFTVWATRAAEGAIRMRVHRMSDDLGPWRTWSCIKDVMRLPWGSQGRVVVSEAGEERRSKNLDRSTEAWSWESGKPYLKPPGSSEMPSLLPT